MQKNIQKALETLNFYRNQHYNAPSGTAEHELANAINDILPLVARRPPEFEFDRTCPTCGEDIDISWRNCPYCGQFVPSND